VLPKRFDHVVLFVVSANMFFVRLQQLADVLPLPLVDLAALSVELCVRELVGFVHGLVENLKNWGKHCMMVSGRRGGGSVWWRGNCTEWWGGG